MIGFYVFTRMISFLSREGERAEAVAVKVFATITLVVTIIIIAMLVLTFVGSLTTAIQQNQ
jgi:hypothetical protein